MLSNAEFVTCYLFVDGGYVRERRKAKGLPLKFDPRGPAKGYLEHQAEAGYILGKRLAMVRCYYFDAQDESDQQIVAFFKQLQGLDDTHVFLGRLTAEGNRRRQKGVDMLLAIEALKVARSKNAEVVAIVAGDQDFVPLVEAIRDEGLLVFVLAFRDSASEELLNAADRKHVFDDFDDSWYLP